MGRGQAFRQDGEGRGEAHGGSGFTKQELLEVGNVSAKVFDSIRKAARVRGPSHGGLNWVFTREDVKTLIKRARAGNFSERGPGPADAWERLMNGELQTSTDEDDEP